MKTLTDDELLAELVPTVAEAPGLVYVWELVPNGHEIFHRGTYRLLEEIQPKAGERGPDGPEVYLRLHGPIREHEHRTIDARTGEVSVHRFTTRTGPVLIRPTSVLVRARIRTDEAPATLTITDREV